MIRAGFSPTWRPRSPTARTASRASAPWETRKHSKQAILRGQLRPVYETALAYYSTVPGVDVTWMRRAAEAMRPEGFVHFDNINFATLTTYNGPATGPDAPYFQLRTMLTPWYQRTWGEVSSWGAVDPSARALVPGGVLSSAYTTETLKSYFAVQADATVAISAKQKDAPYFKLSPTTTEPIRSRTSPAPLPRCHRDSHRRRQPSVALAWTPDHGRP